MHDFTGYCPTGYKYEWGRFEGVPIKPPTTLFKEGCAKACDELKEECKSFEYKSGSKGCHLNSASHPNSPPNKEYIFCSKEG